jgi:hypothetical protein
MSLRQASCITNDAGERQRFADKASQALSERIIPTFHVSRFTSFSSSSSMLVFWDHGLVGHPKIGKTVACTIDVWNGLPQASAGLLDSISRLV